MIEKTHILSVAGVLRFHLIIIGLLTAAYIVLKTLYLTTGHGYLLGYAYVFDMTDENSVSNLISAAFLLAASLLALATAYIMFGSKLTAAGWGLVSFILLFLAIDEGIGIHDDLALSGQEMMNSHGLLFIGWIIPYAVILAVCAVILIPFAVRLPSATRNRLVVAAIVYVVAAMGLEMVEGLLMDWSVQGGSLSSVDLQAINNTPLMVALVAIEESGEMLGVALTIRAFLLHLVESCGVRRLELRSSAHADTPLAPVIPIRPDLQTVVAHGGARPGR